jgi:hypothetical protein
MVQSAMKQKLTPPLDCQINLSFASMSNLPEDHHSHTDEHDNNLDNEMPLLAVEITGLELLRNSDSFDESDFSYDSYARDSFDQPEVIHAQGRTTRHTAYASSNEEDLLEYGYEAVEEARSNHVVTRRRASVGACYGCGRSASVDSCSHNNSYAMDSVQMKRNLPRRRATFVDDDNDSFQGQKESHPSLYRNFTNDISTMKRRISLDATYNFSQEVYDTQSIHGGASRAA